MKVVKLFLFIMGSVAAQESETYHVVLSSISEQKNVHVGYLKLTQCGPENAVQIHGYIKGLPSGWYSFEVHEINKNTVNCRTLGPKVDLGFDPLFDLLDEYIDGSRNSNVTKVTRSLTLEPNKPRTLIGRAIAFSQEPVLDSFATEHRYRRLACGSVLTSGQIRQKTRYFYEQTARDPKYNRATIWY